MFNFFFKGYFKLLKIDLLFLNLKCYILRAKHCYPKNPQLSKELLFLGILIFLYEESGTIPILLYKNSLLIFLSIILSE